MLSACSPLPTGPPAPIGAEVISVYDGDSILVEETGDRIEVRLDGINAPESGECYHREATDHLAELIDGMAVELVVTGADQFGRALAHIHIDDLHVNADMVRSGMAIATTPGPGQPDSLVLAEDEAAERGLGLWGPEACGAGPIPRVEIDFESSLVDPPGPDDQVLDQELVVLVNREDSGVDLGGWTLRDESSRHRFHFPPGTRLGPGESLSVTSADPSWTPGGTPVWNNGGDLILLLDGSGRVVARFRY